MLWILPLIRDLAESEFLCGLAAGETFLIHGEITLPMLRPAGSGQPVNMAFPELGGLMRYAIARQVG